MKIKYSILVGLTFAIIIFIWLSITSKMDIAIVVSSFMFCILPFLFYFKMFYNVDFDVKFQNIDKSLVIYSGLSNHFKDGMTVGGTLYLLRDRLIFQTNLINFIKRHEHTILLNQINDVSIVNTSGFFKNELLIHNKDGDDEMFIVNKRIVWKNEIESQINKQK